MINVNKLNKGIKRTKKVVVRVYDENDKRVDIFEYDMPLKDYTFLFGDPNVASIKIEQLNNHTKIIRRS